MQFTDYRSPAEIAANSATDDWKHQNPAVFCLLCAGLAAIGIGFGKEIVDPQLRGIPAALPVLHLSSFPAEKEWEQ